MADLKLFKWCAGQAHCRFAIPLAKAVSHSGDGFLHLAIPAMLWLYGSPNALQFTLILGLGLLLERPVYWVLKNSLKRRRPPDFSASLRCFIIASDRFSFPSGHTSAAVLLATTLCLVYSGPSTMMLLWASGVAFSRVILGVHFPFDTLAGAFIGSSLAITAASVLGYF